MKVIEVLATPRGVTRSRAVRRSALPVVLGVGVVDPHPRHGGQVYN